MSASAQDVITFKNGESLEAKVVKVGAKEIYYKKWVNPNGPAYMVETAKVLSIKYENGREETFTEGATEGAAQSQSNINGSAIQAWRQYQTAEKEQDNKYLKKRHFRYGVHFSYGLSSSGSSDGKDAALMGSESAWALKASVEYFPSLEGKLFYGGYLGVKSVSTSSNFSINGVDFDDSPLYFIIQPIVGFEYKQFYMKTGLYFDMLVSDDEPYKTLTNGCVVGWPFEIGWTKKFWEIGLFTNVGFSNMYKESKSRPYEFGITLGAHF